MREPSPAEILEFWFGALGADGRAAPDKIQRWFRKDPAFDAEVRDRFAAVHAEAAGGEHEDWLGSPRGRLAYVILLDQLSRNMYRDTPRAFATDPRALAAALGGVENGEDSRLAFSERSFLYMPLMHAEELAVQDRCVELFSGWRDDLSGPAREAIENHLGFAVRHRDIVARFGRFPHRNAILGRPSTPEELEFLQQPGSSF